MSEDNFKSRVVTMILSGKPEEALELMSEQYQVKLPNLKVGLPKKHKKTAVGCYNAQTQTISVLNSDALVNPFVILHEFYHHIRSSPVDKIHRGTEGNADQFAMDFLLAYQIAVLKSSLGHSS